MASSVTNINELPNECLVKIFEQVDSLVELVRLEMVCHRWREIQEMTLATRTHLRLYSRQFDFARFGSLTFLKGGLHEESTSLPVDLIGDSTCQFLIAKFPRLDTLEILGCQTESSTLATLLAGWSAHLKHLSLLILSSSTHWSPLDRITLQEQLARSFPSLRHLYLDMPLSPTILHLVSRLETFGHYENANEEDEEVVPEMVQILPALTNTMASLHIFSRAHHEADLFLTLIPEAHFAAITKQMRQLSLAIVDPPMLRFICDRFHSLTHLDLTLSRACSLLNILPDLSRLTSVTNLRLSNPHDRRLFFPFYKVTTRNFRRRLKTCFSVKHLHLNFELKLIRIQFIQHIFPNVESITFNGRVFRCDCLLPRDGLCRRCSDALPRQLLLFGSLRRVYHDSRLLFNCKYPQSIPPNVFDALFI